MNPLHNSMASEKTGECGCTPLKLSLTDKPVEPVKTYRPIDEVETAIRSVAETVIVGRTYRGVGLGADGTYFVLVRL